VTINKILIFPHVEVLEWWFLQSHRCFCSVTKCGCKHRHNRSLHSVCLSKNLF